MTSAEGTTRSVSVPLESTAQSFTESFDSIVHVPRELRERVVVLVADLVANIAHRRAMAPPERVDVTVRRIGDGVHIEVMDGAESRESDRKPARGQIGLRAVAKVADRWGYTDHPPRVWFEMGDGEGGDDGA